MCIRKRRNCTARPSTYKTEEEGRSRARSRVCVGEGLMNEGTKGKVDAKGTVFIYAYYSYLYWCYYFGFIISLQRFVVMYLVFEK